MRCPFCGKEFFHYYNLANHIVNRHISFFDGDGYICPICKIKFRTRSSLTIHCAMCNDEIHHALAYLLTSAPAKSKYLQQFLNNLDKLANLIEI